MLSELRDDPAFREFSKLQESFQWNIAMRLVSCLEHLLGRGSNGTNDMLIVCTLDLIQGALLLHRGSRTLFAREIYMNLLLDLLDPINCPAVQSATLLTLVTALLDCPSNTRTFEDLDGLLTVTSLFKQRATSREVKLKLVEFLYFSSDARGHDPGTHVSPASAHSAAANAASKTNRDIRTTDEKQALLGRYLNNVEDLVEDLKETAPFGATVY
ncbi:Cell division protein Cdc14 [Penicillium expansum]|nr:Cell division protein Cdc14 [Penicillium expansum]